jgi:hypothetical protein
MSAERRWIRAALGLVLLVGLIGMHGLVGPAPSAAHNGAPSAVSMTMRSAVGAVTGSASVDVLVVLDVVLGRAAHGDCAAALWPTIHLPVPTGSAPEWMLSPGAGASPFRGAVGDPRAPPSAVSLERLCICRT